MNLYCDNYSSCRSVVYDQDERTEIVARVRGWKVYDGPNLDGTKQLKVVLCRKCCRDNRELPPAPLALDGQEGLF